MTDKKDGITQNDQMLSLEDLEGVTGGYLFNQANNFNGGKEVWEIIDDKTGEVLATTTDKEEALLYCKLRKLSSYEIRGCASVEYLKRHHKLPKSERM